MNKKNTIIFIVILAIIIITPILIIKIINFDKYNSIYKEHNYEHYKKYINKNNLEDSYIILNEAIDNIIDDMKKDKIEFNSDDYKEIVKMFNDINKDNLTPHFEIEILETKEKYYYYYTYINCATHTEDMLSLTNYYRAMKYIKGLDTELFNSAAEKAESLKETAYEYIIQSANVYLEENDYEGAYKIVSQWKEILDNCENEELLNMYNDIKEKYNIIIAQKRENQNNANQPEVIEIDNSKKDEVIVDTSGKKIIKVYAYDNKISFKGKYQGNGNFIIELLDDNQDLYSLVANEIGDYYLEKSVFVTEGKMYYIEIIISDGSYEVNWNGTYGK